MLELTSYDRWCTGAGRLDLLQQNTENEKIVHIKTKHRPCET